MSFFKSQVNVYFYQVCSDLTQCSASIGPERGVAVVANEMDNAHKKSIKAGYGLRVGRRITARLRALGTNFTLCSIHSLHLSEGFVQAITSPVICTAYLIDGTNDVIILIGATFVPVSFLVGLKKLRGAWQVTDVARIPETSRNKTLRNYLYKNHKT